MNISIVTVVLNGESTIGECLDSVRSQTLPVEHIVVDGASMDGTLEILGEYGDHLSRVISEQDKGIYDAMNKGIRCAGGEVIGILNADDLYRDERVIKRAEKIFQDPAVDACYGDLEYVDTEDTTRVVRHWKAGSCSVAKIYRGWMPPHPTFFVRRKLYEKYGVYNTALGTAADYELMLRFLLKHGVRAAYIPEVLVKMRTGGASNASLLARLRANRMDRRAWGVNGLRPRPWTIPMKPLRKLGQYVMPLGPGGKRT